MTNLLQKYEDAHLAKILGDKQIPEFQPGDSLRVKVRIIEGANERIQAFEGLCIGRKNRGIHSSFTVRKISHGEGVERTFPLYSPRVEGIEVVRRGVVRRAKLYYMRELTGKSARIQEKRDMLGADADVAPATEASADAKPKAPKKERAAKKKADAAKK